MKNPPQIMTYIAQAHKGSLHLAAHFNRSHGWVCWSLNRSTSLILSLMARLSSLIGAEERTYICMVIMSTDQSVSSSLLWLALDRPQFLRAYRCPGSVAAEFEQIDELGLLGQCSRSSVWWCLFLCFGSWDPDVVGGWSSGSTSSLKNQMHCGLGLESTVYQVTTISHLPSSTRDSLSSCRFG